MISAVSLSLVFVYPVMFSGESDDHFANACHLIYFI